MLIKSPLRSLILTTLCLSLSPLWGQEVALHKTSDDSSSFVEEDTSFQEEDAQEPSSGEENVSIQENLPSQASYQTKALSSHASLKPLALQSTPPPSTLPPTKYPLERKAIKAAFVYIGTCFGAVGGLYAGSLALDYGLVGATVVGVSTGLTLGTVVTYVTWKYCNYYLSNKNQNT